MEEFGIAWSRATVSDGRLEVPISGDAPPDFKQHFDAVERVLAARGWGEVRYRVKRGLICVKGVTPGAEERLRHHLESVVAQAHAMAVAKLQSAEGEAEGSPAGEPRDPRDRDLQERFREFGGGESPVASATE